MLYKKYLTKNILFLVVLTAFNINECFTRQIQHPIDAIFSDRWSPRAMSGKSITLQELMSLFEAGRFAPSAYNEQPWCFIYGFKNTEAWDKLFNLLVPFNQTWTENGSVLVLIVSRKLFSGSNNPSRTHSFDTGAAWENIALQGSLMNLVVHGMSGFDYEQARKEFAIPEDYEIEAMFVVGQPGNKEDLPQELQNRESPSHRKTVEEFAFEEIFKHS